MYQPRSIKLATILFVVGLLVLDHSRTVLTTAAAQGGPQSYTSPTYGYSLSWDDSWTLIQEATEPGMGFEGVILAHGPSVVIVGAFSDIAPDARVCTIGFGAALATQSGFDDVEPMIGGSGKRLSGGDAGHAYASYVVSNDGGMTAGAYVECRLLPGDEQMLIVFHMVPLDFYDAEAQARDTLLANLVVPSPGESGPAFVSGEWRMAIAGAESGADLFSIGLERVDGKVWLVVVTDVTNWSREDAAFGVDDLTLLVEGDASPIAPDHDASAIAAAELDVLGVTEGGIPFSAGQTQRLVAAFQVPEEADELTLARKGFSLPWIEVQAEAPPLGALPGSFGPPALTEARVDGVIDGDTLEVTLIATGTTRTVDLIGAAAPTGDDCYAEEASDGLHQLAGETVWLEGDGDGNQDDQALYAWTEKRDGTRILVNRKLLERGYAAFDDPGAEARFGVWLAETARVAEAEGAGLWTACVDGGDPSTGEAATSDTRPVDAEPQATEDPVSPSAADRAYLGGLKEARVLLDTSLMRYEELVANPQPDDPLWLNQMAFVFVAWDHVHDSVSDLSPTERYADLHETCLNAVGMLDVAAHEHAPNIDEWVAGQATSIDTSGFDLGLLEASYAEAAPVLGACANGSAAAFAEAGV